MASSRRVETRHAPIAQVYAGHFDEHAGYATWRTHGTDDWLIVLTVAGLGRFGHKGGELVVGPGNVTLIRPGTLHDYGVEPTKQHWEMLWAHFHPRPEWLEWFDWPEPAPGILQIDLHSRSLADEISDLLREVVRMNHAPLRRRETFAMNKLEEALLLLDLHNPNSRQSQLDPRIRSAMDHACQRIEQKLSVDILADVAGLSASRFAHLFRDQVGVTPQQFIEQQRLDRAAQLLKLTQLSVNEIATKVGFDNPFYFTLRFKKQTGQSPTSWRRLV